MGKTFEAFRENATATILPILESRNVTALIGAIGVSLHTAITANFK